MIIKSQLSKKDFINLNFVLLYKRIGIKIITGIAILVLLTSIILLIYEPAQFSISNIIFPVIILCLLPLITYFSAAKNFVTNKRIQENIEYQFEKDLLIIRGESFSSQLTWNKIYKVSLTKNWLLIYQSRQNANVISRKNLWDGEIANLKEILNTHNIQNNL